MTYLVLADALARAKERSGASDSDDAYLTELLTLSAGTAPDGVTHFRPFVCAARWLEQNRSAQTLKSAEGVVFTGLATPIASLLAIQAAYDSAQQLTVPTGFEAAAMTVRRYSTRTQSVQSRP